MAEVTLCPAPAKGMHIYRGIKDIDFSDTIESFSAEREQRVR
jgi:hypothetical protein